MAELDRDARVTVRAGRLGLEDSGLGRRTSVHEGPPTLLLEETSSPTGEGDTERFAETMANLVVGVDRLENRLEILEKRLTRDEETLQETRLEQGRAMRDVGGLYRDQAGAQRAHESLVGEVREHTRRLGVVADRMAELGQEQGTLKEHLEGLRRLVEELEQLKEPLLPSSPEPLDQSAPPASPDLPPDDGDGLEEESEEERPPRRSSRRALSPLRSRHVEEEEEARRRRRKLPDGGLQWTFSGDPEELEEFQVKIRDYMPDYRWCFTTERDMVRYIGLSLKGDAGKWFTALLQEDEECLASLSDFMAALNQEFADPLLRDRVADELEALKQGRRSVREYTAAFRTLISQVPRWEEEKKVKYYAKGLNRELLKAVGIHPPKTLKAWYTTAFEAERAMRTWGEGPSQSRQSGSKAREGGAPLPASRPSRPSDAVRAERMAKGLCLKCGKSGHLAAQCAETSKKPVEATGGQKKKASGEASGTSGKKKLGALAIFTQPEAAGDDAAGPRTSDDEEAENFNNSTQ